MIWNLGLGLERLWSNLKAFLTSKELHHSDFYISPDGAQLAIPTGERNFELLIRFLDERGIQSKTVKHPPVNTIEEAEKLRRDIPGLHTKTQFLRDDRNNYFLFVTDETSAVSIDTLGQAIDAKGSLHFGPPAALTELLGIRPSSVSLLGLINDVSRKVTVVLDEQIVQAAVINCRSLTNQRTTSLSKTALIDFLASTGHAPLFVSLQEDGYLRV